MDSQRATMEMMGSQGVNISVRGVVGKSSDNKKLVVNNNPPVNYTEYEAPVGKQQLKSFQPK